MACDYKSGCFISLHLQGDPERDGRQYQGASVQNGHHHHHHHQPAHLHHPPPLIFYNIKVLVDKEMEAIRQKSKLPITMLVKDHLGGIRYKISDLPRTYLKISRIL